MKTKEIKKLMSIHNYYLGTYEDIENLNQYASNKKFNENIDALKEYSAAHKRDLEAKLKAKQDKKAAKGNENKYDTAFENIFKESTGLLNAIQLNKIAKDLDSIKNEIVKPKEWPKGGYVSKEEEIIPPVGDLDSILKRTNQIFPFDVNITKDDKGEYTVDVPCENEDEKAKKKVVFDDIKKEINNILNIIKPCEPKFNPGAKCNEEKEWQDAVNNLKNKHELEDLKSSVEHLTRKKELLNDALHEINILSNKQFDENQKLKKEITGLNIKLDSLKVLLSLREKELDKLKAENSTLATKVCELTEIQLKAEEREPNIKSFIETIENLKNEQRCDAELLKHRKKTIADLELQIQVLKSENKYTKEDLKRFGEESFGGARTEIVIDGNNKRISKYKDFNHWYESIEYLKNNQ